eukprot:6511765-Prymnesium_polylepis.2
MRVVDVLGVLRLLERCYGKRTVRGETQARPHVRRPTKSETCAEPPTPGTAHHVALEYRLMGRTIGHLGQLTTTTAHYPVVPWYPARRVMARTWILDPDDDVCSFEDDSDFI